VERVHAAGAKAIQQVHTVTQAREAAGRGVDVVIAQGSEAGGQGMAAGVGAMALVPQVVDAVSPIPVLAAGGVAEWEGRAEEAGMQAERLRGEIMAAVEQRRPHELTPFTGQTAGLIRDVLPAAEIVRAMVADAEDALERASAYRSD
jgi:NAD(P)H-dependent flavin oxidoreductase YrpB (nitropropane dioxygenase family)